MSDSKMDKEVATKTNWSLVALMIGLSMPIILSVIGIIIGYVSASTGVENTTVERAVILGLLLSFPCGLLNIFVGRKALAQGSVPRLVAMTAISLGGLCMLIGILAVIGFVFLLWAVSNFTY